MPRRSKIKWRAKDREDIERAVRDFNSKIRVTLKNAPDAYTYLPELIKPSDVMSGVITRGDLNKKLASLSRFMRDGAEAPVTSAKGLTTTRWEREEAKNYAAQISRKRKGRIKEYGDVVNLHAVRDLGLSPVKSKWDTIYPGNWPGYFKSLQMQTLSGFEAERDARYKANYIRALTVVGGSEASDLIDKIKSIDDHAFVGMFYTSDVLSVDYLYEPSDIESKIDAINLFLGINNNEIYSRF